MTCMETVELKLLPDEYRLIQCLAAARGISASDLIRKHLGMRPEADAEPQLLVPAP